MDQNLHVIEVSEIVCHFFLSDVNFPERVEIKVVVVIVNKVNMS